MWRANGGHRPAIHTKARVAAHIAQPRPIPSIPAMNGCRPGDASNDPRTSPSMPKVPLTIAVDHHSEPPPDTTPPRQDHAHRAAGHHQGAHHTRGRNLIFAATSPANAVITAR